jgi:hypothetical protein
VTLLAEARAAGLAVRARGDQLEVTGRRSAAPLATRLLARKAEILGALARERFTADPRPDLAHDSALWSRLLARAYEHDGNDPAGLFGALHGLRCCGAALTAKDGLVRLTTGEMSADEYGALRQEYLVPRQQALSTLLRDLAWTDEPGAGQR